MAVQMTTRPHPIATMPATPRPTLDDLNAQLRQAVLVTTTPAPATEPQTCCPHCYRTQRRPFPEGAGLQNCPKHREWDLPCPVCQQWAVNGGCRRCGDVGMIFFTDAETAAYVFDIPFTHHTHHPRWLADLMHQAAQREGWDADEWAEMYRRLDGLTHPGAPWHGQAFAQAAMRLTVAQSGDALLAMLPECCVACYAEAKRLDLPPACRLHPCPRHQAEAEARRE